MTVQPRFPARCSPLHDATPTLPWPTTACLASAGRCVGPGVDRIAPRGARRRGPTCQHLASSSAAAEWLLPPQLNLPCVEPIGADELAAIAELASYPTSEPAPPEGPLVREDEDQLNRHFGRHVRSLRRARGMTQEVLAIRSGLSADTIRRLEHGNFSPSLDTLRKLCLGLDLMLSTLFESYECGGEGETREIVDLLARRSTSEQLMAIKMLRGLFESLDQLE